ncbi:hypothetical protein BG006_002033 [Podila minutissima]|uniref:Uncharacterized protein n=1 Tax=Podila minutissima TaxID=64525 RepID=A0A9P5S9N9_9FUNG|nr:hypothetical protein BG006_002033 [Podila minutissima]
MRDENVIRPSTSCSRSRLNNAEVRAERQAFMAQLKSHVYASNDDDHDKTLQYATRPLFRLTHENGIVTEEEWVVVG